MTVTIRQIAAKVGFSESTVSRALSGRARLKPETVERIRGEATKLGYTPNLMARCLAAKQSGLVGMALPSLFYAQGEFYSRLMEGVEKAAARSGYNLLLFPFPELENPAFLYQGFLDGILILGPLDRPQERTEKLTIPFVLIDQKMRKVPSVSSDNRGGAELATQLLIKEGHKRILFLGGPKNHPTVRERQKGFIETGEKLLGDKFHPGMVYVGWHRDMQAGREAVTEICLSENWTYTAVLAANDNLAIGAIQELQDRGIKIPEQVSVVGFDDSLACSIVRPTLSSVRQQPGQMGAAALEMLHAAITGTKQKVKTGWETMVIKRDSVAAAP